MRKLDQISVGKVFGKRVVVGDVFLDGDKYLVPVKCVCGSHDNAYAFSLIYGRANQCRVCADENHPSRNGRAPIHGLHGNPVLGAWRNMHKRCNDPEYELYHRYGGRGISVCDRWSGERGLMNFHSDMGDKPGKGWSLDRIDNEKGYSPDNCQWATAKQQARNRSTSRMLTCNGETLCMQEWADRSGISSATICKRLKRGWSVARAVGVEVSS